MEKPDMLKPALISGVAFGVASSIPFINLLNCCCLLFFGCGLLSAYLLIRESSLPISYGLGALAGLLAGVFGALTITIMKSLQEVMFGPYLKDMTLRFLEIFSEQIPSEFMEKIEQAISEPFTILTMIQTFILALMIFSIFSTLGGILGVALFGKKQEVQPGPSDELTKQ